jgi:hypothetical protein
MYLVVFLLRIFHRYRAEYKFVYFFALSFDVYLFCIGAGGAVDTGIVDTAEHEHLVVGFIA